MINEDLTQYEAFMVEHHMRDGAFEFSEKNERTTIEFMKISSVGIENLKEIKCQLLECDEVENMIRSVASKEYITLIMFTNIKKKAKEFLIESIRSTIDYI